MKRTIKKYLSVALLPLFAAACAGPKITELDAVIAESNARRAEACYRAQAVQQPQVGFADARDQALIIMATALAHANRPDPCAGVGGMGVYESRARIAEAQNRAAEGVTRSVVSGAVIGTGIIAGADVLKSAINNAGAKTTTSITGDGNSAEHTSIDTRANTTNNLATRGDNAGIGVSNPPVTGPDQSTTTTTNHAPAEAAP